MYTWKKAEIAYLKVDEASTKILSKYADFVDNIWLKLAVKLSKYMRINNHAIKFVDDWQPPYSFIYSLGSVELKILKAYIENNLANGIIRSFKSPAEALILFDKKLDNNLRLCVDY